MSRRLWIKKAVGNGSKGSLRRWAEKHRLIQVNGKIDLVAARYRAERLHDRRRLRQIQLAKTLRELNR